MASCAFADCAANKTYISMVRSNLNVAIIPTLDAKEKRRFEQLWGTDVVGTEEQDYRRARADA